MEHAAVNNSPPHYGSISLVKRMQQQLHPRTGYAPVSTFDPESSTLTTDISFLKGGKAFRSRDRISRFLDHSSFGTALDVFLAVISITFVGSYITNTYIPLNELPWWLWLMELGCASLFAIDFLFRGVYLSNHRLDYIFSLDGLISLIVILPVIPTSFFLKYHTFWYDASYWRFVYPFRFVKCYLECKAVLSRCHAFMTPVRQFAILCYIQIVLIIAYAAGIIQIAETSDGVHDVTHMGDWTFFNSFFNSILVFVTIQTPPADNVLAKVFVGILVIVLILIVPYQIARVLDLGKSFTQYEIATFKPSGRTKHVVLCGDLTPSRIDHFFHEVFHDDHDVVDVNVVVMSDDEPSTNMVALLMDPFFEKRTSFIQGSILDVDDAQRAAVGSADAIFILSRRCEQEEHMTSDHRTLMRVLAAKRLAPDARIFAQMHLSSNRHLLEDLDVKNALYFSEVMHSLLGQNCVCPGFSTFIYNLTSTSSDDVATSVDEVDWETRYVRGAAHELYSVTLPPGSVIYGKSFAEVASFVYAECRGVIMLATLSSSCGAGHYGKILLNPGTSYTCNGRETAFVIARNRREADQIMGLRSIDAAPTTWSTQKQSSFTSLVRKRKPNKEVHLVDVGHEQIASPSPNSPRRQSKFRRWETTQEARVEAAPDHHHELGNEKDRVRLPSLVTLKKAAPSSVQDVIVTDLANLSLSLAPILVCVVSATAFPYHLEYLIGPLRVKALHHHRPVVVLSATLPSEDQFEAFRHFKHVYLIQGNPFVRSTLKRAGAHSAHKIVLMGDEGDINESGASELLADASCIALHKTITSLIGPSRAPRVISELVNRANVHFISQNLIPSGWFPPPGVHDTYQDSVENGCHSPRSSSSSSIREATSSMEFALDFAISPAFASGLTYSTSLCDSLMINQYFNPMLKNILREFIFASWKDEDYVTSAVTPPPSADVASPNSSTASMYSPTASDATGAASVQRSSMFTVEVPLEFIGKTFEYVFHHLLWSDGILTLGLYRCRPDRALWGGRKARIEMPDNDRSMPFGYVYVNPFPQDVLTGNDLLYVLSPKQPCWA
ncbi:hypothetical protein Poli38472_009153 [Pythium oligandrum]|uniref:RCK N-terminal domain-containing protein n=1 Tax=Pythium oligandrum TaxID=41045 RepID=A0A8K1CJX5_PYTOL|nr:hypothetical protein Poli38472_009153 [Pythium oligandrum]|eukprot:TMW64986.1 hypothetical protein Poli38472_009153 [Pythium oligandrum]